MEEFKKKLQRRLILLSSGLCFACAAVILSGRFSSGPSAPEHLRDFMDGFQLGIILGIFSVLFFIFVRILMAIRSPDRLKKLYISETDERKLFILQKSGSSGMNIVMYGLAVATAVAGNFNNVIFFTLLGATLFVSLVRLVFKLYYHKKY